MNYELELKNYLNKIYDEKIYQILVKEELSKLNSMELNEIKSLINSKEIYFGSDLDEHIISLIPKGFKGYLLREAISKSHNLSYPILYDMDGQLLKQHTHNSFSTALWEDFTNKTFLDDLNSLFASDDFYNYVNENLDKIYADLIKKIEIFKSENIIEIPYEESHLVNTVKDMILNGQLDYSYALSFVDLNKLRDEMEFLAIDLSLYDEFDKLQDDLKECLDKFFKYDEKELFNILVNKEDFILVNNDKLVKKI